MIHSELHRSGKSDDDEVGGVWKEVVKTYSKACANIAIHECEYLHKKYQIPQWRQQEARSLLYKIETLCEYFTIIKEVKVTL